MVACQQSLTTEWGALGVFQGLFQHSKNYQRLGKWTACVVAHPRHACNTSLIRSYLSKINTNEDAHAIAVSQFKMRRLRPGQPAIADELRRFPPAVTPSMLAILQDVAVRTHKERLANRIQWHKSPPKLSSAQQAAQAAAKRRQVSHERRE